jgi:cytochrome b subunit of formate dehydrogenase
MKSCENPLSRTTERYIPQDRTLHTYSASYSVSVMLPGVEISKHMEFHVSYREQQRQHITIFMLYVRFLTCLGL